MLGFLRHHQPTVLLWLVEFDKALLCMYFGRLVVRYEPQHARHRLLIFGFGVYKLVIKEAMACMLGFLRHRQPTRQGRVLRSVRARFLVCRLLFRRRGWRV